MPARAKIRPRRQPKSRSDRIAGLVPSHLSAYLQVLRRLIFMKLFECQNCGQPLYFENTRCESCGRSLGYLVPKETVTALEPDRGSWRALADPKTRYRYCANVEHGVCNWLVSQNSPDSFCAACRPNRKIP